MVVECLGEVLHSRTVDYRHSCAALHLPRHKLGRDPEEAADDVTPEVADEVTDDVTPEVADDVTPEVADEVADDVTPEVADDVTPEVDDDVTPEATPEEDEDAPAEPEKVHLRLAVPIWTAFQACGTGILDRWTKWKKATPTARQPQKSPAIRPRRRQRRLRQRQMQ